MHRQINAAGVKLIHGAESLELEAYPDPGSPLGKVCTAKKLPMRRYREIVGWQNLSGAPWTIGWGHTGLMPNGQPVKAGDKVTEPEADQLFAKDVAGFEKDVTSLVKVPISDNQFAALVSFAYNCGSDIDADDIAEGLGDSTLLKKVNAGDFVGAAEQFGKWVKSGGVEMPGLVTRRAAERKLFETP